MTQHTDQTQKATTTFGTAQPIRKSKGLFEGNYPFDWYEVQQYLDSVIEVFTSREQQRESVAA